MCETVQPVLARSLKSDKSERLNINPVNPYNPANPSSDNVRIIIQILKQPGREKLALA